MIASESTGSECQVIQFQPLLLESAVSSDLDSFVEESVKIANRHPELLVCVEHDLDMHGLKKKHLRQCDLHFLELRTDKLNGLEVDLDELASCSTVLEEGRPRMPSKA